MEPGPGRHSCPRNLVPLPSSPGSVLIQKRIPAPPGKARLAPAILQRQQYWSHREHLQERHSFFMEESLGAVRKGLFLWVCVALSEAMWAPYSFPPATPASMTCLMLSTSGKANARRARRAQAVSAEQEGAVFCQCQDQLDQGVLISEFSQCTVESNKAIGPQKWNGRSWLWSLGTLLIPMSIFVWGSHVQQNSWKCARNVDFFIVVLAKEINLISLALCSTTVLEEGDSRIIHL